MYWLHTIYFLTGLVSITHLRDFEESDLETILNILEKENSLVLTFCTPSHFKAREPKSISTKSSCA